jgi:hypothetical protein
MRFARWITKAKTHAAYVVFIAFPWQEWLCERVSQCLSCLLQSSGRLECNFRRAYRPIISSVDVFVHSDYTSIQFLLRGYDTIVCIVSRYGLNGRGLNSSGYNKLSVPHIGPEGRWGARSPSFFVGGKAAEA